MILSTHVDQLDSMYPSEGFMLDGNSFTSKAYMKYSSVYGYSYGNTSITIDSVSYDIGPGQYFSFFIKSECTIKAQNQTFVVFRLGYKVQNQLGWVEQKGRLSYIDGCSDSLLVYPSRLGDPSLNLLFFPEGIEQSFHLHPSIRIGCVIKGEGFSSYGTGDNVRESPLTTGSMFCLIEQETHRFRTTHSSMSIIAWHPDGDWGPTDHNHTMLNRTYIRK